MPGVCPRCLREVYFAEEKLALGKVWHTFCFSCRNCRKLLDSCTVATHCGELFCRNCCTRLFAPSIQPPSPPPTLDLTSSRREARFTSAVRTPTSACDSFSDCYCCCGCQEDCSIGDIPSEGREARLEKKRLRGGGGEEEEEPEDFRLAEETQRCSESECSNLGVVSSITTLCNAPSSPTAVTTWYNRQHSASQSTFGGQSCAKNHLGQRSSSTASPVNVAKHFPSNNSDCSNIETSWANGGHKYPAHRITRDPCNPSLQQHQKSPQQQEIEQELQEPKFRRQQQQQQQLLKSQLQAEQTQQLLEPQEQKQHISERLQQQQHLQLELHHQELKQQIQSSNFSKGDNNKNENNRYPSSLQRFSTTSISGREISRLAYEESNDKIDSFKSESRIRATINSLRGKPATRSPSPTFKQHHHHLQYPRRRVSFCSDVPEETSSCASGLSCPAKMSNDIVTTCHNNHPSASGSTTGERNPNNYSSSSQSCNGTPYETCYEMDEPNTAASYSGEGGTTGYDRSSDVQIEEITDREEETRLRGGCGGCGTYPRSGCGGCATTSGSMSCPPRDECHRETASTCGTPSCDPPCGTRGGCCAPAGCRPICRKPGRSCCPPCVAEPQGCGGGGCCGGGCRGGCGKPGRLCMPLRPCSAPPCQPQVCRPRGSPCMPPRCSGPTPPCCKPPGVTTRPSCGVGGGTPCCRSKSPRRGCCSAPQDDAACGYCGPKLPPGCECLGGGLDCQRCGRKVYQAEMQIASGVPYHNICFSCFCCRKPLEPLTYQENCGEIYCKQCYVRNFGPQGYGYGAGAGVLQTPM